MNKFCLIGILWFSSVLTQAQPLHQFNLEDSLLPKTSYGLANLNYLSDNVYLGRKDSIRLPYFSASLGYYHKSGLYMDGSVSYLPLPANSRIDLVTVEAGYTFIRKHWEGQISADKYFFSSKSTNIRSEVTGTLGVETGYDFGFVQPTIQASISFGKRPDYGLGLGLEHSFLALDEKLDITPTVLVNASTQNFYGNYYSKRRYTGKRMRKHTGISYYDISANLSEVSQFKLLDYEYTMPINYTVKRFTFNFTPTVTIPVNPAIVNLHIKPSNGAAYTRTQVEKLTNSFFFQAGLSFQL